MSHPKILIVDPNHQSAQFLSEDLDEDGYQVIMVTSGTDALGRLGETTYDLVLVDRNLQDIDGIRMCQKIRETYTPKETSIIVISSFDDNEDRNKALVSGADEYICKPFLYSELLELVHKYTRP